MNLDGSDDKTYSEPQGAVAFDVADGILYISDGWNMYRFNEDGSIDNIIPLQKLLWSDLCQEEIPSKLIFSFLTDTLSPRISWKGSDLTVPGMWPLCYTWIGYRQANGSPWVPPSEYVDQRIKIQCQHSLFADDSNLDVSEPFQDTLGSCSG